jgi:uncharacterized protein
MRIVAIFVIGFCVGILSGLLGIGGGILMIPAMIFLLGMSQHQAHGTSLAAISLTVLFSAIYYGTHGQVNWVVAVELALGGTFGAMIGARICALISAGKLRTYFGTFVAAVGIRMLYDAYLLYHGCNLSAENLISPVTLSGGLILVAVGVLTGILSGLLGIGGGILMIPAMVLLLGFTQTMAQGISLAVIIPVSISGALIHRKHGNVRMDVGIWLAFGGIFGGLLGAQIAIGQQQWVLRSLFGLLMLIMGALMIRRRTRDTSTQGMTAQDG